MLTRNHAPVRTGLRAVAKVALAGTVSILATGGIGQASAYIGDSFLSIPGASGHWKGTEHKGWIRAEANAWTNATPSLGNQGGFGQSRAGAPPGPQPGQAGGLTVMVSRDSPDAAILMARCTSKAVIPELTYSESSTGAARGGNGGVGGRAGTSPGVPTMPAYWDYKLKDVQIVDCPTVPGAIEQAFVLSFKDSQWLNYDPKQPIAYTKAVIPDVKPVVPSDGKRVKAYLITWLGVATDAEPDQCPQMNARPTPEDVYRYMTPEQVAAMKAKDGDKGFTFGPETEKRGPHLLNVNLFPGIIPDPGLHVPQAKFVQGIDLDGNDGKSPPPKGIRKHTNYTAADGRTGIDNQLYSVVGCVPGLRGKQGYRNQTDNARRADGNIVTLVEVSNITNDQNDDNVEIALIHSRDKPVRDNVGKNFIGGYSFRPTDDPRFAAYNIRVHGRIVNGVVMSDRIPKYSVNSGQGTAYDLFDAQMRFEPLPDGSVKGYIAGYQDWRYYSTNKASGYAEGLFNYQQPALWYALKRAADGLWDPVTGEYNGISTVYELDTVTAFLTPDPPKLAQDTTAPVKSR